MDTKDSEIIHWVQIFRQDTVYSFSLIFLKLIVEFVGDCMNLYLGTT
jgi:hypothetical protein